MFHDLRFAFRMIAAHGWFSATLVCTLALGIGVNTTVFTLVNAALFRPVPVPGGDRLLVVTQQNAKESKYQMGLSLPDFLDLQAQTRALDKLEASSKQQAIIGEVGNPPERYSMGVVSDGLFGMIQTRPVLGRAFSAADCQPGAPAVVVLSYSVWQQRYGGAPNVLGRNVRLNGTSSTIVGVMPAGFNFPNDEELWTPLVHTKLRLDRTYRELRLYGLLHPGVSVSAAQSDLNLISNLIAQAFPDTDKDVGTLVQTFHEANIGGPARLMFLLMLGAVGFVLLIACANVANMMLGRAEVRGREIALRAAIGASRWQITRQLLVESVVLSVLGGLIGLFFSTSGVHAFDLATRDVGKPFWIQFTMDWRAFAYFAAISVLTGLIFGIVPAWRSSHIDLNTALKNSPAGGTRREGRLTGTLVVSQFALTLVLLVSAGLMIRSFFVVQQTNPFVPGEQLFTARVSLPNGKGERYENAEARRQIQAKMEERFAALPGVTQAALGSDFPGLGSQTRDIEIDGHPAENPQQPSQASAVFATPNYISVIGLPLVLGRTLGENEGTDGHETTVVTRAFAARYWPHETPLGRHFRFIDKGISLPWITVVGVCADLLQDTLKREAPPLAYFSLRQEPAASLALLLRTNGDATALASGVRTAVQEIDPDLALSDVRTLAGAIEHEHWFLRVFGTIFLLFALIALLMASVGIYAVVAHSTARRTREIGIRMALGAQASRVVWMVLARGLRRLGLGLVLGLAGTFIVTRLMSGIPGMVSSHDPLVLGAVVLILSSIGILAGWIPARRAASVVPTDALRAE